MIVVVNQRLLLRHTASSARESFTSISELVPFCGASGMFGRGPGLTLSRFGRVRVEGGVLALLVLL